VEEARQACAVECDLARCVGPPKLKRIFSAHLCRQEHVRGPAVALRRAGSSTLVSVPPNEDRATIQARSWLLVETGVLVKESSAALLLNREPVGSVTVGGQGHSQPGQSRAPRLLDFD